MPTVEPDRIAPTAAIPITSWAFGADADAPVVIAVHDFTANGLWFGDLADACSPGIRLVAPDLRGRAGSVTAPPPATLDDHVTDLLDLADRLGAPTFPIVGHGTGAMIALAAAEAAKSRVTRVLLLDGPPIVTNGPGTDWLTAAARVDPGSTRMVTTWAHRDAAVTDGVASGRIPTSGMSRSLRRAVEAEITGSGFGWRARLAAPTLEHDWALLQAWIPPSNIAASLTSFPAMHGHRFEEPPIERWDLYDTVSALDTTHSGLLVDPAAVGTIVESIISTEVLR